MDEKSEKKLKGISKALSIVSKVIKVFVIIGVVGCVVAAIMLPLLLGNISFKNDTLKVGQDTILNISTEEDKIKISTKDQVVLIDSISVEEFNELKELLTPKTKSMFLTYIEGILFITILALCIFYVVMNYCDKLFKNIYEKDSPFNLENIDYIRKIAYLLIAYIVVPLVFGGIFELITGKDMMFDASFLEIFLIIVLFLTSYVFEYGYSVENKKAKLVKEK